MSVQDSLNFYFGIMPEIDKQAQLIVGGVQIVDHLCSMFIAKGGHGFQFYDYFIIANKIRYILLLKGFAFVS